MQGWKMNPQAKDCETEAVETPIGYIPKYEDLQKLFKQIFGRNYTKKEYEEQFSIRIGKFLQKLDRVEEIYAGEEKIPEIFHKHLTQQRTRLNDAKRKFGQVISPFEF